MSAFRPKPLADPVRIIVEERVTETPHIVLRPATEEERVRLEIARRIDEARRIYDQSSESAGKRRLIPPPRERQAPPG